MNWIVIAALLFFWRLSAHTFQDTEFYAQGVYKYTGHNEKFHTSKLELVVEPMSPQHYTGEPLKLSIKIRNAGSDVVRVPLSVVSRGNMFVRVFDAQHNNVEFFRFETIREYSLSRTRYIELQPTEFWGTETLTDEYNVVLSKPGTYYIQVKGSLEAPIKMKDKVWVGGLRSAPLKVFVLPSKSGDKQ